MDGESRRGAAWCRTRRKRETRESSSWILPAVATYWEASFATRFPLRAACCLLPASRNSALDSNNSPTECERVLIGKKAVADPSGE